MPARTIVHPYAKIIAEKGSIEIGSNNIISEQVEIYNRNTSALKIGDGNTFECRAYIETSGIGHYNVINSLARLEGECLVQSNCIIGTATKIFDCERLSNDTVVYGKDNDKRTKFDDNSEYISTLEMHQDYLKRNLIKFHTIRDSS
ncbi:hypothetical protein BB561_004178 [Smittium simulii]|uniref:Dynactin subunit 6 n=1 Tax=Smittium simulii TaxID=133385 RepID=A0A2T9YHR8_9FUNG|nr:hypothetical protein BB561_004178 [Smittium simulii]